MNRKKKILAVVITVIALFLIAAALVTVLVVKTLDRLEDRWEDTRYEDRDEDDDRKQKDEEKAPVEEAPHADAPVAEAPAVEATEPVPVETVEGKYQLGLVLFHTGDYTDAMAEQFAEVCMDLDMAGHIAPCRSGDPMEVMEYALMLMETGVDALAVSCPDPDISEELATIAADMGIVYIALDAVMDTPYVNAAALNIDCWGSTTDVAMALIGQMGYETDYNCDFAILGSMEQDPVAEIMLGMLDHDKYKKMNLLVQCYGDGSTETCMELAAAILEAEMPDVLLCTDPQATEGAARIIVEAGFDVRLIGFGIPSQLDGYLVNALVHYYDPKDVAELTARAMIGILEGTLALNDNGVVKLKNGNTYGLAEWEDTAICGSGPITFTEETVTFFSQKH